MFLAYAASRLAWTYGVRPTERYYPLETLAGRIRLKDESSLNVYRFVISHTQAGDLVADFAWGGAVNFAARRSSPLFMEVFSMYRPAERYLQLEVQRMQIAKPKLAIGVDNDLLGSRYGALTTNGCMFPALVWRSSRVMGDPQRVLPVITHVLETYTTVLQTGGRRVLLRNDFVGATPSGVPY